MTFAKNMCDDSSKKKEDKQKRPKLNPLGSRMQREPSSHQPKRKTTLWNKRTEMPAEIDPK
jgi:hypothetical protein